ncbi:MAG TPA: hypothetical protein PKK10_00355 [Woeseiaceae bacterium]|nr:hypothetical protein [Woeseiaceae bacterium]
MKAEKPWLGVFFLTLSACGGGGGDGSTQKPVSSSFALTSANAVKAAGASWQAARTSEDYSDLAGVSGAVISKPGSSAKLAKSLPSPALLERLLAKTSVGPEVLPCEQGGSITISGELENPLTLTPGDLISVDANNCDNGVGDVIDGLLEMTINAFSGDYLSGVYDLSMTLMLKSFQVTTGTDVKSSNGDVTVSLNTMSATALVTGVSGNSLRLDANAESMTLVDFSSAQLLDVSMQPASYTLESSGTLDSTRLPGSVIYSTPVTFEGTGSSYPHAGEFLVTGEHSSARLVVIDSTSVRIDLDTDGDGVVDEMIETSWAELDK